MFQSDKNKELEILLNRGALESKKIVVAEDDDTNYFLIKEYLEFTKAEIIWARNGRETIDIVENEDIDLVLMDIQMPEIDGFEALKSIRGKHPDIPIVAITAFAVRGDKEKGLRAGFNDYLSKPVSRKTLMEAIVKLFS
jgi:CheY-like chemotaxis protein